MINTRTSFLLTLSCLITFTAFTGCQSRVSAPDEAVTILIPEHPNSRLAFGVNRLQTSLGKVHYSVEVREGDRIPGQQRTIVVGALTDPLVKTALEAMSVSIDDIPGQEGFAIRSERNITVIGGADSSGTLYGCLDLSDSVESEGRLPDAISKTDQPEMVLRGTCVGLQKTFLLPGRGPYEYPITPENFPWFYNKDLWIKYLDMLVENRYNTLYLWNGHPFASLVRLKKYPYAVEVDSATFRKTQEMYHFLTTEANKRGIWVIQMFYNIIVSKPFAEHNGLKTQDRDRPIIPIIADYTRRSIAQFVQSYPNVGLLVCLGEAMTQDQAVPWFTKTIIPGVKDGLAALGRTDEPPIILRGHATDAVVDIKAALPLYKNLYTMAKYSGESLTTYRPRGEWAEYHRTLSKLGSIDIDNVHINANLEPFRWGSPDFMRKAVLAMHTVHTSNGIHIYPQANYWDWPYTAYKTDPRLQEMDRDWIWYQAWARYAWNSHRDSVNEHAYWSDQLGKKFGAAAYGSKILDAYEHSGLISPMLIRRFGITEGNRQTLSLGMFMSQLVDPARWGVFQMLYESDGPPGETLTEYAQKEWDHRPHTGETPAMAIKAVVQAGSLAVQAIEQAAPHVTENRQEFARLQNDMYCYNALANFYTEKVKAAMLVLRYKYSQDISDLEKAVPYLESSLNYYQQLVDLTKNHYLYANSLQTAQRRIPISGRNGSNKTWAELLPAYEQELASFKKNIALLKSEGGNEASLVNLKPLQAASVKISDKNVTTYRVASGGKPFTDEEYQIENVAPQLEGLEGIRFSMAQQMDDGTEIHFKNDEPVKVAVGFFNAFSRKYVSPSALEYNAHANDRGEADIRILNAVGIPALPPVNIHTYYFEPGDNTLDIDHGACLVLGFIKGNETITRRDAGLSGSSQSATGIDWLFY